MNHVVLLAISVGFGSLAWSMLAISDWLLGDKTPRPAASQTYLPPVDRLNCNKTFAKNSPPRGIVLTARKAS